MSILLVAATATEITPLLEIYRKGTSLPVCDILVTGVGLMAATQAITRQLQLKKPGVVIQAGIAGCFDRNLPLGSVVYIRRDGVADVGVREHKEWKSIFDLGLMAPGKAPYKNGWLENPNRALFAKPRMPWVNGVTVNCITTSKREIELYTGRFAAVAESMEGAALHYTCLLEKIPFLQVRSFSNYVGVRDKKQWRIRESIENLNQQLVSILPTIKL